MIESMRHSKVDSSMNFMQNTIEQYNQIRIQAKLEMSRELDKMPIGKFHISNICMGDRTRLTEDEMEERKFRNNVSTFLLMFKDYRWEYLFLREPDVLLKYSIIIAFIVFVGILLIQGINRPSNKIFWIVNTINGIILLCFVVVAWYKKVWIMMNPAPAINLDDDLDGNDRKPRNKISRYLYNLSDIVMRSIVARGFIYLITVITLCLTSLLQLTTCVDKEETPVSQLCVNPWAITESLILTICMSFLFSRIPFLFKLFIEFIIVCMYGYFVMDKYKGVYNESATTNRDLNAVNSHMMLVIFTFAIFHLIDRQSEYISKVDYTWKRQLQKKQEDAEFTNETIKILIHNILPAHVADIYMMKKMKDEHYFEEYDNVAVMFATIKNYDSEKTGLDVLNGIICDFDEKLMNYKGPLTIEKIKIAGWSYMAACGLDETRCSSASSVAGNRTSSRSSGLLPTGRRLNSNAVGVRAKRMSYDSSSIFPNRTMSTAAKNEKQGTKAAENVVFVMTEFALELMKSLQAFNRENFQQEDDTVNDYQFQLRIGISHGKVMAGVVGSSKPLYDIWGNAVNMASRMDSTGIPGYIQVTQETAEILQTFSIKCEYRGLTFVKGCDHIPTYFVGITDDLSFIRKSLTGPNHTYENLNVAGMKRNSSTNF